MNIERFFSGCCSLQSLTNDPVPPVAAAFSAIGKFSSSVIILSPLSAAFALVPSMSKKELAVADVVRATSAVKSCPPSASGIWTERTCSTAGETTLLIVKSALLEFSTILSDSAESDNVMVSPETNVPTTFVNATVTPVVVPA